MTREIRISKLVWLAEKIEQVINQRAEDFGDSGLCERDAKDQRKFDGATVREYRYILRQIAEEILANGFSPEDPTNPWEQEE